MPTTYKGTRILPFSHTSPGAEMKKANFMKWNAGSDAETATGAAAQQKDADAGKDTSNLDNNTDKATADGSG